MGLCQYVCTSAFGCASAYGYMSAYGCVWVCVSIWVCASIWVCVGVHQHMGVCQHMGQVHSGALAIKASREPPIPRSWDYRWLWGIQHGSRESNLCSLQEKPVLLTIVLSSHPSFFALSSFLRLERSIPITKGNLLYSGSNPSTINYPSVTRHLLPSTCYLSVYVAVTHHLSSSYLSSIYLCPSLTHHPYWRWLDNWIAVA